MTDNVPPPPWAHPLMLADLSNKRGHGFELIPDAGLRKIIAAELGLLGLKKLRFTGELTPLGKRDWQLSARLGASVVQACVLTLAPVATRIDETVERSFHADVKDPEAGSEFEIPAEESAEPLAEHVDPGAIMLEALALALPEFPRAPGAALENTSFTEPGKTPMSDAEARPFSALKDLQKRLKDDDG